MQARLRPEIDADRIDVNPSISEFRSSTHSHEIICRDCGGRFYTDRGMYDHIARAIEEGLDNPFVCPDCRQELDELAHQAR